MKTARYFHEGTLLALVLLASFLLKLRHLGHAALTYWDECFHAIVARNLMAHPLRPTLVEAPYLPFDFRNWTETHIWLHKGILPLWQIALSFAVLGVNTFALRLPSAVLSTASVWLTYAIGRELLDRRSALIAAALQAFNFSLVMLVHGYLFSDHVDTTLLFWVELGIYFLIRAGRTGKQRYLLLAGIAQGLAFLTKRYLAAIILLLALAMWLLPLLGLSRSKPRRIGPRQVLTLLAATLVTLAPWLLWCLTHFRAELLHELFHAGRHLDTDVEGWGAPWDRLLFDYLVHLHFVFYAPGVVAVCLFLRKAAASRHTGLWLTLVWLVGVMVPHLLAESKTPSATVIAMPPFFLLLGHLIAKAFRGHRAALAALTGVTAIGLVFPAVAGQPERGYPDDFAGVMLSAMWVVWHVIAALVLTALVEAVARRWRGAWTDRRRRIARDARRLGLAVSCAGLLVFGGRMLAATWRVIEWNRNDPAFTEIAAYARSELPDNAVLLVDEFHDAAVIGEHKLIAFRANRTCYILYGRTLREDARRIVEAGGIPYLVSPRPLPFPRIYHSDRDRRTIYAFQATASRPASGTSETLGLSR